MTVDPGLGRERTELAWQRTALSLLVASAILLRLRVGYLGMTALLGAGVATVLSAWVFLESRFRYTHSAASRPRPRGGRTAASLAVATASLALTELVMLAHG